MFDLFRYQRFFHHDPKRPHHHHDDGGAVIESHGSGSRKIQVVRNVLDANNMMAEQMRRKFAEKRVFVLNVMSSPGSGKTTTLVRTLGSLMPEFQCAVIVGDICSTHDADKLAESGAPVIQINTDQFGGECHLAAHVIDTAVAAMDLDAVDLLIVENIGNLVCPAEFDIGEDLRVVMLSVTEGEDKPIKYPLMFRVCDAALINKVDLLPYLDLEIADIHATLLQVHPDMPLFDISAKTGQGIESWVAWLRDKVRIKFNLTT
ncbi:MAG: hydrogenase nickel incorporation protein HypB [Desulfobacteraceae bacterium]|jgi:hydrogenase nickel incorporation protein HypB